MGGSLDNEDILQESRKQMNAAMDIIMRNHPKLAEDLKKNQKNVDTVQQASGKTFKKKTISESIEKSSTIAMLLESLSAGPFKKMMQLQLKYMIDWGRMQGISGSDEDVVNSVIVNPTWHNTVWPNILKHKHPELINR